MAYHEYFRKTLAYLYLAKNKFNELKAAPGYSIADCLKVAAENLDRLPEHERYKPLFTAFARAAACAAGGQYQEELGCCLKESRSLLEREQMPTQQMELSHALPKNVSLYSFEETIGLINQNKTFEDDPYMQKSSTVLFLAQLDHHQLDFSLLEKAIHLGYKPGQVIYKLRETKPELADKIEQILGN